MSLHDRVSLFGGWTTTLLVKKWPNGPHQKSVPPSKYPPSAEFLSFLQKSLSLLSLLPEMEKSRKMVIKLSNNKMIQFSREFKKTFCLLRVFIYQLRFKTIKVCHKQKKFGTHTRILKLLPMGGCPSYWLDPNGKPCMGAQ